MSLSPSHPPLLHKPAGEVDAEAATDVSYDGCLRTTHMKGSPNKTEACASRPTTHVFMSKTFCAVTKR